MKEFTQLQKRLILLGIIVQLVTAWFSVGYNNADEHWQILEFANYKLGIFTHNSLPWEFREQIRNAFVPFLVYGIRKFLFLFNITDPFITTFILRLISAALSITCNILLLRYSFRYLISQAARNLAVALSFLLWFMPYLHCRFSSEAIGGVLFFFGFLASTPNEENKNKSPFYFLFAGFLFGLSFLSRFQMAFAVAGLMLWMLFIQKIKWKNLELIITGGCAALGVGLLIDYWFYGNFVITVYNYYTVNIVQGVASRFGVMPVWFYLTSFIVDSVPPLGLLLFAGILLSMYYFPRHPFTWIIVTFLVAHSLTPHKEIRFLFPLIYTLPLISVLWMEKTDWANKLYKNVVIKILYCVSVGVNIFLLLLLSILPAKETIPMFRFIYRHAEKKEIILYSATVNPYQTDVIEDKYYQSNHVKVIVVKSMSSVSPDSLNDPDKEYLFADNHFSLGGKVIPPSIAYECVNRSIPEWLSNFNYNNWQSRANPWCIYSIKKAATNY